MSLKREGRRVIGGEDVMIEAEVRVTAVSQGMLADARRWKRQGDGFSSEPLEGIQPC